MLPQSFQEASSLLTEALGHLEHPGMFMEHGRIKEIPFSSSEHIAGSFKP